jgi:uncharacterized protein DUF4129
VRRPRAGAVAAFFAAAVTAAAQDAPARDTAAYRGELVRIKAALDGGDTDAAREGAQALTGATIVEGSLRYEADASVLGPIARASDASAARAASPRLSALIRSLDAGAAVGASGRVDPALLESLRREQTPEALRKSGEVSLAPPPRLSLEGRVLDTVGTVAKWLEDTIGRIVRFLRKLWPDRKRPEKKGAAAPVTVAIVALAAGLLGFLAYRALRRRGGPEPELASTSAPTDSRQDEDPLSREANEWERYARELEAAGRSREAIRAWYHAVLVTLFRQGTLHYEKGRTNWEYAAQLPPEASWRPTFLSVTRRFDREWYGRASSDPDVLRDYSSEVRRVLAALRRAPAAS